jgi:hypothetical protein
VDESEHEMFVTIRREENGLAMPLSQLRATSNTDAQTKQAAEGWLYCTKIIGC